MQAVAGVNTLDWMADDLCTYYWIQRVELTRVPVTPRIESLTRTWPGRVELRITGEAGHTHQIEVSTNLVDWSAVTNLMNPTGTLLWSQDTPAGDARRFYRILQLASP